MIHDAIKRLREKKVKHAEEKHKTFEPVQILIEKIDNEGNLTLGFNQDLIVPDFVRGRSLSSNYSLSSIDVSRDIMDIFLIKEDPLEENTSKYFLTLKEWNEK